ncbi:paraquat-inducible protein A [Rubrimonas cliftonensis]|uniref:Paraquat-inducible protein A n=1 Tax=Rubrimonas cliftonensis TaxID=89524 RepID=A0A1H3YSF3_9RHOB|nr:paraquat-inducible protein A [Rubrimonas cliftonensis]SEA14380.1 Paraquat-inducible protein A [Rubrimonas cliftonensis]
MTARAPRALELANLAVLALLPVAWAAPLMRAQALPFFPTSEISILSGVAALWETDAALAVVVALFALAAPLAKGLATAAALRGLAPRRLTRWLPALGRLAMADVFLVAVYVVVVKGVGLATVETGWGLHLFTALVLAGLALAHLVERSARCSA